MSIRPGFADFIRNQPFVILGGAMGTELQRRGYKTKLPLWSAQSNLDAADLVAQIHSDYLEAGADIIITNTFRTTPRTFRKVNREAEARDALRRAVTIAHVVRKPFEKPVYIGGSFAPLEDCYRPDLVPDAATLTCEHFQMAGWLAEEGVDFLLPETINALSEACIMAKAAASTGLPFLISFVVDSEGRLLDGTPIAKAVAETNYPTRIGVALNCRPIDILDTAFKQLSATYKGSIALYPNGFGHPHDELGWTFENNDDSIDKFVATALKWHAAGARFIGGCCGTTPDYIRKLAAARAILENEKTPLQKQWA